VAPALEFASNAIAEIAALDAKQRYGSFMGLYAMRMGRELTIGEVVMQARR
jgi:hypothetical protein